MKDIRFIQRFSSYKKAMLRLEKAVLLSEERELTELEKSGLLQTFEFCFELAWKTMKDFLNDKGFDNMIGSKDVIRRAFAEGLITDGEMWMSAINDRNLSSHIMMMNSLTSFQKEFADFIFRFSKHFKRQWKTMNEFGLSENAVNIIRNIFTSSKNVARVDVFGSRAKGNYRNGSDIDFAIFGNDKFCYDDLADICGKFEDSDLPYFVDCVNFATIKNDKLKEHILRVGKTIFRRENLAE